MTTQNPAVQKLLDEKIRDIAGVRGAVVFSEDGLVLYASGVQEDFAQRRAAVASSLGSIADHVAFEEQAGAVKRTLIDMEEGYVIVARCGQRSQIAVSASHTANLGTVGYELSLLATRLAPVLDAEQRQPVPGGKAW
ncbi:roadblock/LC7 domain-containing protein [Streptomyces sp. B6B3]|jgi:predicted regulator of Ras-like GTPase activity (Roadblock/LC7/MglB family)|uniref:roadblock/LC7 domain-containing protein n=1 Tax=Streptomyces sp. B6B3 TaxID=3153570 RepID=UPI00325F0D7E